MTDILTARRTIQAAQVRDVPHTRFLRRGLHAFNACMAPAAPCNTQKLHNSRWRDPAPAKECAPRARRLFRRYLEMTTSSRRDITCFTACSVTTPASVDRPRHTVGAVSGMMHGTVAHGSRKPATPHPMTALAAATTQHHSSNLHRKAAQHAAAPRTSEVQEGLGRPLRAHDVLK